jgi:gliding motility-associated lipoprotein GldD
VKKPFFLFSGLFGMLLFAACRPTPPVPKPRGYARLELPAEHEYQLFQQAAFPYRFEYPVYAEVAQDTAGMSVRPVFPYWLNVNFPAMNATLYVSYNPLRSPADWQRLTEDSYELSQIHNKRASYVKDGRFKNDNGVSGMAYEWGGASASVYQFIATDSTRNFLRGALYFNVTPNADSLKPAIQFLQKDIEHLMQTLVFKN